MVIPIDIELEARAYDDLCQSQINADNLRGKFIEREVKGRGENNITELYQIFELENLEYLSDLHLECGVFRRLSERFYGNNEIKQLSEYFIRLNNVEIEKLIEDINYDREKIKEYKKR